MRIAWTIEALCDPVEREAIERLRETLEDVVDERLNEIEPGSARAVRGRVEVEE